MSIYEELHAKGVTCRFYRPNTRPFLRWAQVFTPGGWRRDDSALQPLPRGVVTVAPRIRTRIEREATEFWTGGDATEIRNGEADCGGGGR